jgi:hypothetical protein
MIRSSNIVFALVFAACVGVPTMAIADDKLDDLDVTMEVLDNEAEFGELVNQMRGPDASGIDENFVDEDAVYVIEEDLDTEDIDPLAVDTEARADRFERDAVAPEEQLRHEDDWEDDEGEDRDLDIADEEPDDYY